MHLEPKVWFFFSFSFYYINVNLQLNRLCILPPPPQNPSATTIRDRGSRCFCISSFWYVYYINVNLQLNRLCILPPPVGIMQAQHFIAIFVWFSFLALLFLFLLIYNYLSTYQVFKQVHFVIVTIRLPLRAPQAKRYIILALSCMHPYFNTTAIEPKHHDDKGQGLETQKRLELLVCFLSILLTFFSNEQITSTAISTVTSPTVMQDKDNPFNEIIFLKIIY